MKILLITSLALVIYLLRPVGGESFLAYLDGPATLWIAVSLLAISRIGNRTPVQADAQRSHRTHVNPLSASSFASSSFLSPNKSL